MKFLRAETGRVEFHLSKREKEVLLKLLDFYPRSWERPQPLTRSASLPDAEGSQQLLEEALAEQRAENQKQLTALLTDGNRFGPHGAGWRLSLSPGDMEWLLQVLNDIRIGNWAALGSPEEPARPLNRKNTPHLWAMEIAGAFQMHFLQAIEEQRGL